MAVTLLPEPDSPTMPRTFARSRSNETPSTARTVPSTVAKCTLRSSTSRRRSAISRALGRSDSRVEVRVEQVDDHAEGDDKERAEQRHAHDRRQVEVVDRECRVLS